MLDFTTLQTSTDHPTAMSILLTVLFTLALSSLIVLTYDLTTKAINRPLQFLQSMALISIVAATVMQAIGDSLARGLGMLGALAIIRFRTTIRDPRNMSFMFASLATGIACGVNGYTIAIIGTVAFCLIAIVLRFSPFAANNILNGTLRVSIPSNDESRQALDKIIKQHCTAYELREYKFSTRKREVIHQEAIEGLQEAIKDIFKDEYTDLTYTVRIKKDSLGWELTDGVKALEFTRSVRISFDQPIEIL